MIPAHIVTVGQNDEAILGTDDRALQAGIERLAAMGGGTLKIGPGTYRLRNELHLRSHVRVEGSGEATILTTPASRRTRVVEDSDWWDDTLTVEDADGFDVGMAIFLEGKETDYNQPVYARYTIMGRQENRLQVDREFDKSIWREGNFTVVTTHSIIRGEHVQDIEIADLVIDGNRAENDPVNDNHGAAIFLQRCSDIRIEGLIIHDFNGDGVSWQIVHDLSIRNCVCRNNAELGLHAGSGSRRPVMENNRIAGGTVGIFFCWGVKDGVASGNEIEDSNIGFSLGYRDTDNVIRNNRVRGTKTMGVEFQDRGDIARNPHRTQFIDNEFIDCGPADGGCVVDIRGKVCDVIFSGNRFEETRTGNSVGIIVNEGAERLVLSGNTFSGFTTDVKDLRKA